MIKYHPYESMLVAFAAGELPTSLTIAVSAHAEMCPECQAKIDRYTEMLAEKAFNSVEEISSPLTDSFSGMLSRIFDSPQSADEPRLAPSPPATITVCGDVYALPRSLRRFSDLGWSSIGPISRARLPLNEEPVRSSLLHIQADASVPTHTHSGYELTLLLDGEFEDENDKYIPGDFIWLDSQHHHTPFTKDGCLCYTVADAPLHFTKGASKLLNAVGNVIY
ncbi:ChrR family anti-sigma-E factor [Parasalinivibrio latis]|uniref:ChrR family anti-sigma-E factor n=1 Tax=Parasalinivibrio latis TaxID=2952610 RepID=UPI0030DF5F03